MKKLISVILIFISIIIMVSCGNDFISSDPPSSVSVDNLYKTNEDFEGALTAVYDVFQEQYQDFWIFGDVRADDSWEEISKSNSMSYSDQFVMPSSEGLISSTWRNYYSAIYRINTILSKIKDVDASVVTDKERFIGEAKFLRALGYFDLVRIFGDVPMVTTPLTSKEAKKIPREPVSNIYDQVIVPDLLAAEKVLPLSYTGNNVGRPTKGAAKAILGRVYLTIHDFKKAETKLQEVTTMGYALLPNYDELFDYTNEHNSEYIFDIEYEGGIGEGSSLTNDFLPNSQPFVKFYGVGGYGGEHNDPTDKLINLFSSNDMRKNITVGVRGGFYNADSVFIELPSNTNQTYTKKYITGESSQFDSKANWKVIRYADVLLMYAEALNENGKTNKALDYLNQVRERAGLQGYSNLTPEEAREKIYLERRLELSFEGVRWFDLLRTGRAYKVMKDSGMKPYMTVFPLPLKQVDLIDDPEIFPQNPGYK